MEEKTIKNEINEITKKESREEIQNIILEKDLITGKEIGPKIKDINYFPELRHITIKGYTLTQEELTLICQKSQLESISFTQCDLSGIRFDEEECIPESLQFLSCQKLPKKYPKVSTVNIYSTLIDLKTIDLSEVEKIYIRNSQVLNTQDLTRYDKLKIVNLNGSTLQDSNGNILKDISVPENCQYNHNQRQEYEVDNRDDIKERG